MCDWFGRRVHNSSKPVSNFSRHTTKFPYGEISVRRNFFTAKFPYGEISLRRNILRRNNLRRNILRRKFRSRVDYCRCYKISTNFAASFLFDILLKISVIMQWSFIQLVLKHMVVLFNMTHQIHSMIYLFATSLMKTD